MPSHAWWQCRYAPYASARSTCQWPGLTRFLTFPSLGASRALRPVIASVLTARSKVIGLDFNEVCPNRRPLAARMKAGRGKRRPA
jgi:hypothetical protein